MLDMIFILVLLLNLTGLFAFIAPMLNVNIAAVSLVLLVINCLYIIVNYKITLRIVRKKHIFYWFIFLVLWPLLASMYAPAINYRQLGLQIYYFTLLLAVVIYLLRNGFKSFHHIVAAAAVVTIFGLILSMFTEDYFQSVASITQNDINYEGRAYGFFMQPNQAAMNSILLFVVWFAGLNKTKLIMVLLSSFGLLIFVSLTGSRGGFITAIAAVLLIFIDKSIRVRKPFKILISPKYIITFLLVFGSFLACVPLLLSFLATNLPEQKGSFKVTARIKAISQMKLAEKDSKGKTTVGRRWEVTKHYYAMICERPILGNGFGSTTILQDKGLLGRSSHNQYLNIAFETGVFCLIFYLFLLVYIYADLGRKRIEQFFHTNSYIQFLTVVALAGMTSHMLLDSRTLYCILGCFLAMLISPKTMIDDAIERNM
jgi:O-antigen ligase